MSIEKTFTVCGTARNVDGTIKARVANDLVSRIKILVKYKCTDINLIELPEEMTKYKALEHIKRLPAFSEEAQQDEIVRRMYDIKETQKKRDYAQILSTGAVTQ